MPVADPRASRASRAGLALVLLVAGFYLLHAGQGTIPHYDEWDWITRRRGISDDTLLEGHNGHLSLVPVVIYKALLQIAGLGEYWVFRVVLVAMHLGCAVLVFLLARRRVGDVGGAFAAGFVAVLGAAGDDLLWAFQIGFVGAVLFGLGGLLALDHETRRGDAAAAVLLGLSLASASVGAAFIVAAAVEVALHPRRRERWWVVAAPLFLYALWYLGYGEGEMRKDNIGDTPDFVAESGSAAAGGLLGLGVEYGRILLTGLTAVVVARLWRGDRLHGRLLALVTAPVALWVLTGLSRAQYHEPQAPRYIYTGAILLVLLVCELARGRAVPHLSAAAVLAAGLLFAAVGNATTIDATSGFLRTQGADTRARLGALDLARAYVPPGLQISPVVAPQIFAGVTLSAERDFGDIGLTPAQLVKAPQVQAAAADEVLRAAGALTSTPVGPPERIGGPAPVIAGMTGGSARRRGACIRTRSQGPDARLDVDLPEGQAVIIAAAAPAGVLARRFGDVLPTQPVAQVDGTSAVRLAARPDAAKEPWRLQVASAGNVRVCRAGS